MNILDCKSALAKIKNSTDEFKSKFNSAKEIFGEVKAWSEENTQIKEHTRKKKNKKYRNVRDICDINVRSKMGITERRGGQVQYQKKYQARFPNVKDSHD